MPPIRRRPRNPLAGAVLGVRVRMAEQAPVHLKLTEPRRKLMQGIDRGEVRPGTGQYEGGWRWHHGNGDSETVTYRMLELLAARWARRADGHAELTDDGRKALEAQ